MVVERMNPEFRTATVADIELLLELMREFYSVEHLEFHEGPAANALTELIEQSDLGMVVLVQIEDAPAGYFVLTYGFSLEFHGKFALLDELYVRPSFQGKGIGRTVMSFVEDECRARGIAAVRLEVDRMNANAQHVYRTSGYADQNRDLLTKWIDI